MIEHLFKNIQNFITVLKMSTYQTVLCKKDQIRITINVDFSVIFCTELDPRYKQDDYEKVFLQMWSI